MGVFYRFWLKFFTDKPELKSHPKRIFLSVGELLEEKNKEVRPNSLSCVVSGTLC